MAEQVTHHRHGRRCSERIAEIENELADVRREFESAGRSYLSDVQAHERETVRLRRAIQDTIDRIGSGDLASLEGVTEALWAARNNRAEATS